MSAEFLGPHQIAHDNELKLHNSMSRVRCPISVSCLLGRYYRKLNTAQF